MRTGRHFSDSSFEPCISQLKFSHWLQRKTIQQYGNAHELQNTAQGIIATRWLCATTLETLDSQGFASLLQDNDQMLDDGQLGVERKLYYRELVSRFGHHVSLLVRLEKALTLLPHFTHYVTLSLLYRLLDVSVGP